MLGRVRGDVGAGSGANFRHYPTSVNEVVAVEPELYLRERAERAARTTSVSVSVAYGDADCLPGEAESFDAGVVALVLCTVPDQQSALAELYRGRREPAYDMCPPRPRPVGGTLLDASPLADIPSMSPRQATMTLACALALLLPAAAARAYSEHSVGSPEQIAWVRRAAGNFVAAEFGGNGAGACTVLNAPLRATEHHRTCEQRWNVRLRKLLQERGARSRLRTEQRAIPTARVVVHGNTASIELPAPLLSGPNRFLWTENCWMLTG